MKERIWILIAASLAALPGIAEAQKKASVPPPAVEYCEVPDVSMGHSLQWGCSGERYPSIAALERSVAAGSTVPAYLKYAQEKSYESPEEPFVGWVFYSGDKAARFRKLSTAGVWSGVGVTTYCSDTPEVCKDFASLMAQMEPRQFVFKLGPPPPMMPSRR